MQRLKRHLVTNSLDRHRTMPAAPFIGVGADNTEEGPTQSRPCSFRRNRHALESAPPDWRRPASRVWYQRSSVQPKFGVMIGLFVSKVFIGDNDVYCGFETADLGLLYR